MPMAHIRIENSYLRTPEFLKFSQKVEFSVLLFLTASIARKPKGKAPAGATRMYNKYYKNKNLCASYSMNEIAKIFGWGSDDKPNKSYVSKIINNLKEMGLIKIHIENTPIGKKYVYELGYYVVLADGTIDETLYFDKYFSKFVKKEKKQAVISDKKREKYYFKKKKPVNLDWDSGYEEMFGELDRKMLKEYEEEFGSCSLLDEIEKREKEEEKQREEAKNLH